MATMTFLMNDTKAGATTPTVRVTVTENADGSLAFSIEQIGGRGAWLGDLRGFFFDVADERLLGSLTVAAPSKLTEVRQGNDSVRNLGQGANMKGLPGTDGYDVGIEIGRPGAGRDDVRSFGFTLRSSERPLTLDDLANVELGVRITSIGRDRNGDGVIDTARCGGAKIGETLFNPVTALNDDAGVIRENATARGNVLANDDGAGDKVLLSVAYNSTTYRFSGSSPVVLSLPSDTVITIFANGDYIIDATNADRLAQGAELPFDITYVVQQTTREGDVVTDEAHLTGRVGGVNDAPVAVADTAAGTEGGVLRIDVLANDMDVDAGHVLTLVSASAPAGKGAVSLMGNGLLFDAGTAFEHLALGATELVTLAYTMQDEHGATSSATVALTLTGLNDTPVVAAPLSARATENGATFAIDLLSGASDVDAGETATLRVVDVTGLIEGLSLSGTTLLVDPAGAAFQGLAEGMSQVFTVGFDVIDVHGAGVAQTAAITVVGINDAPEFDDADDVYQLGPVNENQGAGVVVGTVRASDVDVGDRVFYAITGGNSAGRFAIDPTTGVITTAGALDYEAGSAYRLTVEARDRASGGLTDTAVVEVAVGDVQDALRIGVLGLDRFTSFLGQLGHTAVSINGRETNAAFLDTLDVIILNRVNGTQQIANWVSNGGLLITEWAAADWAADVANIIRADAANIGLVGASTPITFTQAGIDAGLSNGVGTRFSDGSATEFFWQLTNIGPDVDILATRGNGIPVSIGASYGQGNVLVMAYDWQDRVYSSTDGLAPSELVLRNALSYEWLA